MWTNYPLVRLAIPFVAGMLAAQLLLLQWHPGTAVVLPLFVALAVLALLLVALLFGRSQRGFGGIALLFSFVLGATLYVRRNEGLAEAVDPGQSRFVGVVESAPQEKPKTWAVRLRLGDGTSLLGYFQKDAAQAASQLREGDSIALQIRHIKATYVDETDGDSVFWPYRRYLFSTGISATGYVPQGQWERTAEARAPGLWNRLRQRAHEAYAQAGISSEEGAIVEAMTLGQKAQLTREQKEEFSRAGLSHLLALSGFHLSILLALFDLFLFRSHLPRRWRRALALLLIPLLWCFVLLVGLQPSLVRAAIMCSVVQLAVVLGREEALLNGLAIAALAMLAWEPLNLLSIGFQLSFVSMLAIALMGIPLCRWLARRLGSQDWKSRIVRNLGEIIAISVSCTLFTFPLVAYHFGQVPVLSLLSNVLASLIAFGVMWLAVVWWLLFFWPWAQALVTRALLFCAKMLGGVASGVAALPFATLPFRPSRLEVALLYALLVGAFVYFHRRSPKALSATLLIFIAFCLVDAFA